MKEILGRQSKETRCYIMAALMVFEGFKQLDDLSEIHGEMFLDVLGLTKSDMNSFAMPDYSQIVSHLKPITDIEVMHFIITNTYSPVLKSRRIDALDAFRNFCSDLEWDKNIINESMKLTEDMIDLKPIDKGIKNESFDMKPNISTSTGSGCLSVVAIIIAYTALFAFTIMCVISL
ncbi:MAG: hypothetical protein E7101_11795 [Prevotella ruminicola]|uniref:Uncharacterized protein n=1 Tax=Xylanibacter ruminicola TaxID=839 RepID=A0A9D5P6B0_XYLRU|nr:hypothetical protein [Xylanibacter ruminicola]